jgi:F-type H+-transporting ATPase subunit delta
MSESVVAERYAHAIFELGEELGKLTQLSDDVRNFAAAYSSSADLRGVLGDPVVSEDKKASVIRAIGSRLAMCTEAVNSIRLIARRRRLPALTDIAAQLGTLTDEKHGVVRVKVTSAAPLSEVYLSELVRRLEASIGKRVALEKALDPSLIAGVLTQIGDDTIDGTIKGRLTRLEGQLNAVS